MWEPFNPHKMKAYRDFPDFLYRRPEDRDSQLQVYARQVLSGDIQNSWIDREVDRFHFQFRILKEVRGNLFLRWLHNHVPEIPLIFMIRHPCAVVLSRMEAGWDTEEDIQAFVSQKTLVDDFLSDKMALILNAVSQEEKHAAIWAIQTLVPILQFADTFLNLVFYEDLCTNPEEEIPRIFKSISQTYHEDIYQRLDQPSRTVKGTSAVMRGEDKVRRWQEFLTPGQIRSILSIVEKFGLDCLYGNSFTPLIRSNKEIAKNIRSSL
jgi:hypothetical protein